ncbi:MAG: CDGSH iron-sulfur domain-containing protein, partial [Pseudomonadales bacterium]
HRHPDTISSYDRLHRSTTKEPSIIGFDCDHFKVGMLLTPRVQIPMLPSGFAEAWSQKETQIMPTPRIAQKSPFPVDVEKGKTYFWCACGKSANQPFCDGSHADTEFLPVKYPATESARVFFCGCKQTHTKPLCDGTHNTL